MASLLLALLLAQDPAELVDKLRSDDIEVRDQAARRLEALGAAAVPALREAVRAWDPEMGARASRILRLIEIAGLLTPAFRAAIPDAPSRIANGQALDVLSEALGDDDAGNRRHPLLRARDAAPAAALALDASQNDEDRMRVLNVVKFSGRMSGTIVVDRIVACLSSRNEQVRNNAAHTLGCLGAREAARALVAALDDETDAVAESAALALAALDAVETSDAIVAALVKRPFRKGHLWALADLGVSGEKLVALADQPRCDAAALMRALRASGASAALARLADHPRQEIRGEALAELASLDPAGAQALADRLLKADQPPAVRHVAASRAGADAVRACLRDPDGGVRELARLRLAELRGPDAAADLLPLLDEPSVDAMLIHALAAAGARQAVPRLAKLLDSEELGDAALDALVHLRADEAVPAMVKRIRRGPERVWGADVTPDTARRLASIGSDAARAALRELAADPDAYLRRIAVPLLGGFGGVEKDLAARLADDDSEVRAAAVTALAPSEDAADAIARLAKDASPVVRAAVAGAARRPETARGLLRDADPAVREAAIEALGRLGARESVGELRALLRDPGALRRAALLALVRIAGRDAIPDAVSLLPDSSPGTRVAAAQALAELDARDAVPKLEARLADPHRTARFCAAEALCRLGSRAGVDAVIDEAERANETPSLLALNRLRRPEAWARLANVAPPERRRGTLKERLAALAAAAGVPLEASARAGVGDLEDGRAVDGSGFWAAVERELPPHACVILEDDRLRVVSRREALQLWRTWAGR